MKSLSQANVGTLCTIKWNFNDALALEPGTLIRVIGSYFGNIIISVEGKSLAIDKHSADRVKI